ncbi:MAG: UDP-N-acetylmuramate--L-alanine ligase [Planctomycetaceae bacterium]
MSLSIEQQRASAAVQTHLIGVCGAGMKALAEYLVSAGARVTGSDLSTDSRTATTLRSQGVELYAGHAASHLPPQCRRVVHSAAIPADNPERVAARAANLPLISYPKFIAELSRMRQTIGIAGTHGKSTTTAAIASLLSASGPAPDVLCGAEVIDTGRNGWSGDSRRLVVECCEYRRHFLDVAINTLLLTGIEWDHVDSFASLNDTLDAFVRLLRHIPQQGRVIYNGDCRSSRRAIAAARIEHCCAGPQVVSVGWGPDNDWRITDCTEMGWGSTFDLVGPNDRLGTFVTRLPGRHNVSNLALAAVGAFVLNAPASDILRAVERFSGVWRRLQQLGEWRGMTLIDDYAHHPTAVQAVLNTVHRAYPKRFVRIVFQPHQAQRTIAMSGDFCRALSLADSVTVLPAFAAREVDSQLAETTSRNLVDSLRKLGRPARFIASLDHVLPTLETEGRPGDVVLLAGAGSIERVADEFTFRLCRNHAG